MNKKYIFWIILIIAIIVGILAYFYISNNNNNSKLSEQNNYKTTRTIANNTSNTDNSTNTTDLSNETNNVKNTNITEIEQSNETQPTPAETEPKKENPPTPTETEVASFTTKIYTKDPDRQNNISISCSTLNDTTIENGSTFSFTNTVGKATSKKGYEEANVFKDGKVVEALGGGICQVSTTLYNALLKMKNIDITERHSHSNSVPYIKSGKDAAVAYGSYDLKFVNNTGSTLKIKADNSANNVTIKILKIE